MSKRLQLLGMWMATAVLSAAVLQQVVAADTEPTVDRAVVVQVARSVSDFTLTDVDGQKFRLSQLQAPVLLVVFWASWEKNSQKHLPVLAELQRDFGATNLVVVAIALDEAGSSAVKSYREKDPLPFRWATATAESVRAFGDLNALPTTYVLDRRLNLMQRYVGTPAKETIAAVVRAVLAASSS